MEKGVDLGLLAELPENIPDKVLGKFPHFDENHAHPTGLIDWWEAREYWNIPLQYRDKVCHGYRREESKSHKGYTNRSGIPVCATCGKPPAHLIFYCFNCGELFIKDFRDTRFCALYPYCYDCLSELSWAFCPDHTVRLTASFYKLMDNPTIIPPIGMNPRKFTEEELRDAFDDESLWEF